MKKVVVLFFVAGVLTAKSQGGLDAWLATSATTQAKIGSIKNEMGSFIASLSKDKRSDIKFLRKSVGLKQKVLAGKIVTAVEHLSRCENGSLVMSPTMEKLLLTAEVRPAPMPEAAVVNCFAPV